MRRLLHSMALHSLALRSLALCSLCSMALLACETGPDESDGGARTDGAASMDASVAVDAGHDAGAALGCQAAAEAAGWSFCSGDQNRCEIVFEDGTGCAEACDELGLACVRSHEDTPGSCGFQADQPELGCADTGHTSDYCVCGAAPRPDAGPTDAGPTDAGPDAGLGDAGARPAHEALLDELVGFGEGTTGGAGGPVVEVTNLNDSGPGSLREAATRVGPAWIRFRVSGVIALESNIDVTSDKTFDGRGADVTITGGGLFVQGGEGNVIVAYLKLRDSPNDLLRLHNGGSHMWVHHCDLSNGGDGAFDATEGVTAVTVSYTHIFDHDKAMLLGAGSDTGDGASMRWTGHHNWYEDTVQRLPFIRFGRAHSYNNLYMWVSGTAMSVRLGASQMLVENSVFMPQTNVGHKLISEREGRGAARIRGNLERPQTGDEIEFTEHMPETVFDPSASYAYTAETADDALIARLRAEAGWQDVPFPE